MLAFDAQQISMLTKYIFFLFIFVRSKDILFTCEKIVKIEHTICDCNLLSQDI